MRIQAVVFALLVGQACAIRSSTDQAQSAGDASVPDEENFGFGDTSFVDRWGPCGAPRESTASWDELVAAVPAAVSLGGARHVSGIWTSTETPVTVDVDVDVPSVPDVVRIDFPEREEGATCEGRWTVDVTVTVEVEDLVRVPSFSHVGITTAGWTSSGQLTGPVADAAIRSGAPGRPSSALVRVDTWLNATWEAVPPVVTLWVATAEPAEADGSTDRELLSSQP